jgi:5'(3')-deoxyribonucleotidase
MNAPNYEIILDFDDVIYPFCQGIMAVLAEEGIAGTITQWELENDFGIDKVAFWEMVYQPKHHEALFMQPIPLATLAQMRRLRYAGHRLHIVTARTNPTSERFAMEVIRRDNVPVDSITFTKDKAPMVDELNASFSLDDGPHNYEAFTLVDHLSFLMDAPHNQHVTEFASGRRVSDVTDFANTVIAFQEHGVQMRGAA